MHADRVRRRAFKVIRMQAVMNCIFTQGRKESRILTLTLNSQDDYDVRVGHGISDVRFDSQTFINELSKFRRHHGAWTGNTHPGAQLCQQVNIRARDARMKYVADDRHLKAGDVSL